VLNPLIFRRFAKSLNYIFMRLLICAVVLMMVVIGCKEDELYGLNTDTRAYLLAGKKWQYSAIYVTDANGTVIRDEYTPLPDFIKDNYLLLRADSTFELNDNINRDPLAPSVTLASGRWRLISGEQFLKFDYQSGVIFSDSVRISSINASAFTLQTPAIDGTRFYSYRALP
jgi:hypothetical protein